MNTKVDIVKLWDDEIDSYMTVYVPQEKTNDCAILIFFTAIPPIFPSQTEPQ